MGRFFDTPHIHGWDRPVTRRQFLGRAAGATAASSVALGSGLLMPQLVLADDEVGSTVNAKPIPGGDFSAVKDASGNFILTHHFRPKRGIEAATITDFNGFIGLAEIDGGTGTGTDHMTGATSPLTYALDNRFLIGEFVGVDGEVHRGAWGFV
jgi:hypothetical protein